MFRIIYVSCWIKREHANYIMCVDGPYKRLENASLVQDYYYRRICVFVSTCTCTHTLRTHRAHCVYTILVHVYTYVLYMRFFGCTFRGIARTTMTKETFHVLLLHLTPNIHFSFCQNIKCTLFTLFWRICYRNWNEEKLSLKLKFCYI